MKNGERITNKLIELHGSADFSIAFLPYKRSMWSSMQSVYDACVESGIDAHIYPMPYYLMNHKRHVERIATDRFDNGENINGLKTFDFVVIHYPYDSHNVVTQMLPKYYIWRLREIGKVVYIPYSQVPMPQLWTQKGITFVDYAFLSTENDAAYFIDFWKRKGKDFTNRAFGLGSPKLDIQATSEPRNNTVLIATSLMEFLRNPPERMQRWREAVYAELASGRFVTFRPHPLLFQTIKAMRPDMLQIYKEFIDGIRKSGVMVDLSEELEQALLDNEYLISDPSSIIAMWEALEKPYRIM